MTALGYGSGPRGVVLVPGAHGVAETWELQAQSLARADFRVLALDYRGLGRSAGQTQDDSRLPSDILAAVLQLRSEGVTEVSVVGASWGGWAAGAAALARPDLIDRLVFVASSRIDAPERLGGRKLFIVAREDRDGSGRPRLEEISRQFEVTPPPRELVVLEGSAHAQLMFLTPQRDRLFAEILRFLKTP